MAEQFDTVSMLARTTKDVEKVLVDYVQKGKLFELAIILFADREKVMAPIASLTMSNDSCPEKEISIREYAWSELVARAFEMHELQEKGLLGSYLWADDGKTRNMIVILQLLDIFEWAGDAIVAYARQKIPDHECTHTLVINDIEWLLQATISSSWNRWHLAASAPSKFAKEASMEVVQKQKQQNEAIWNQPKQPSKDIHKFPAPFAFARSFHTSLQCCGSQATAVMMPQAKNYLKITEPQLANLSYNRLLVSFSFSLKRMIRHL